MPPSTKSKPKPKLFEILSTDEPWDHLSMMVYGSFGIGKTWFAGTAVQHKELGPVLLIDNDGGSRTLRGKPQFKGIKVIRVYHFEAYNEIYDMITSAPKKFRTVIIDNLNEAHTMAMQLEMQQVMEKDASRELHVPSQREYGIVRAEIRKLIQFFNNLGCNLIVTCHAQLMTDEVDRLSHVRPALAGKLAYEVPGLLGIVGYLDSERRVKEKGSARQKGDTTSIVRVMHFQPYRKVDAKDQSDTLGISLDNPTIPQVAKLVGVIK